MSLIKGEDEITLVFNQNIKISGIPVAIDDFQVNGRSTLDWLVNQYQINKDKDTLLISDPNAYIDQDKYVFNLVPKLVNLSMTTIKILESVPKFQYLS
jgi:predicted helicase